jgi:amino acid adenylation domain-containing protein
MQAMQLWLLLKGNLMDPITKISISEWLYTSAHKFAERVAIEIDGECISYQALLTETAPIIHFLYQQPSDNVAMLCQRNSNAYLSIFACLLANKTYVPLPIVNDANRLLTLLDSTNTRILIISEECADLAEKLLELHTPPMTVLYFGTRPLRCPPQHHLILFKDCVVQKMPLSNTHQNPQAYILFTSGSTGKPKAVSVGQTQLCHYLMAVQKRYKPGCEERFSQLIEFTFDLSLHDILLCWISGATLCVFNQTDYLQLARYLKNAKLTFLLIVPSTAIALERVRQLVPNHFPTLRTVLFCGEPLPHALAKQFSISSPNALIENIYGPTEATIAFTAFEWKNNSDSSLHALVPIGKAFPGLSTRVINQEGKDCLLDEPGELLLSGPQVVEGYIHDPVKTGEKFMHLTVNSQEVWYRTGDWVTLDSHGILHFKGRMDEQLQIQGIRTERLALEILFKEALNMTQLVLIPSPVTPTGIVLGIALIYLNNETLSREEIRDHCLALFTPPFIPTAIIGVDAFPVTISGKTDYKKLKTRHQQVDPVFLEHSVEVQ